MKIFSMLVIVGFLVSLFIPVFAQDKKAATPEERAVKLTGWMKKNLDLTAEQEQEVREINLKYANKSDDILKSSEPKMKKAKAAKANDQAKDTELKTVLTPEQFNTYQTKKEELKEKAKEKRKKQSSSQNRQGNRMLPIYT